jgi:hypothetical protein
MGERLGQVAAARLLLGQIAADGEIVVEVQKRPEPDAPRDRHREADLVRLRRRVGGGQCPKKGEEVRHVLPRGEPVGGIGKGRVVVPPLRRDAVLHGGDEFRQRPAADAMGRIGGDVWRDEGAEIAGQRSPACEDQPVLALGLWHRVARRAAPGPEHRFPGGGVALQPRDLLRCDMGRRGQGVEPASRGKPEHEEEDEEPAHGTVGAGRFAVRPRSGHCSAW